MDFSIENTRRCQLNNKALGNLSLFLVVRNTKISFGKQQTKIETAELMKTQRIQETKEPCN